jgi:hypothetical protein
MSKFPICAYCGGVVSYIVLGYYCSNTECLGYHHFQHEPVAQNYENFIKNETFYSNGTIAVSGTIQLPR